MFQSLLSVVGVCEGMKKMPVGWEMGLARRFMRGRFPGAQKGTDWPLWVPRGHASAQACVEVLGKGAYRGMVVLEAPPRYLGWDIPRGPTQAPRTVF